MSLQRIKKEGKLKKYCEKILKLVGEGMFGGGLEEMREYSVKNKIVPSRAKFDKVLKILKKNGEVCVSGKTVVIAVDNVNGIPVPFAYIPQKTVSKNERNERDVNRSVDMEDTILDGITKINKNLITGRVIKTNHDNLIFIANNGDFYTILNSAEDRSRFQDKICVMDIDDSSKNGMKMGHLIEIVGEAGNPISEYDAIASSHGANMSWEGEELQKEIDQIPTHVDLEGRKLVDQSGNILQEGQGDAIVDLRELPFTTVDPATCKDMDDAIYSTYENGELVVYTAVANVPKYVNLDSEIGRKYIQGAFTIYSPNKAYNILPTKLSTGICSLNEGQDRLAVVVKTVIDEKTGKPKSSRIMDAVINSHGKFSYIEAQDICDFSNKSMEELKEKISSGENLTIAEQILFNEKASQVLWKGFNKRNTLSFDTQEEYDVVFNDDLSQIEDIVPSENCAYHKVIEAFMLTANEATARFAIEHKLPNIYRIHDMPDCRKVEQATEFFNFLGISFDGDLSVRGIKKLLYRLKDTPEEVIANRFLVRMQSKAEYTDNLKTYSTSKVKKINNNRRFEEEEGFKEMVSSLSDEEKITHFALQSIAYSHSTSPIRRLPDYVTLNNIIAFINGHEEQMIDPKGVHEIAGWANDLQNENTFAEEEFSEFNSACYCEDKVGMTLTGGIVSGFKRRNGLDGIENLDVVVEEKEKGIKILVPATEFVGNVKNAVVSKSGVAIINKYTNKPIVTLCEEIKVKITSADRKSHIVRGSIEVEKVKTENGEKLENNYNDYVDFPVYGLGGRSQSRKRERMLTGRKYDRENKEEKRVQEGNNRVKDGGKGNGKDTRKETRKRYPRNITL